MAILSVNEHHAGRRGGVKSDGSAEYARQFLVITDTVNTSPDTIRAHTSIPDEGVSPYPTNSKATCIEVSPVPYGDQRKIWMVEVKYASTPKRQASPTPDRPWNRKPVLDWGSHPVTEILYKDKDGDASENSAGDRFDPPLSYEKHFPTLTITRYERRFEISRALEYIDHVNLTAMIIAGLPVSADQALLTEYNGRSVEVDGKDCWEVTYSILFSDDWKRDVIDQGFYYLSGSYRMRALDGQGNDSVEPVLLDGEGGLAGAGGHYYRTVRIYPRVDFRPLGLP